LPPFKGGSVSPVLPPVLTPPVVPHAPPVFCPPVDLLLPPVLPPVDGLLLPPVVARLVPPVPELSMPPVANCCTGRDEFWTPPLLTETPPEPADPVAAVGLDASPPVSLGSAGLLAAVVLAPPLAAGMGPPPGSAPAESGLLAIVGGSDEHPGIERTRTSRVVRMEPRRMQISSMA
jgi:hypothetical protein